MFTIYATDYAPVDPITPPCDIVPIFIGYRGENKARCLVFDLTECVNTFGDGGFVISFIRQGDELPYLVTDTDRLDNNAIWIITDTDTAVDGYGMVQLQYIVDDVVCKSALYRTVTFDSNGIPGDVPDPYEDLLAQIAAYAAQAEGAATTATAAAQAASTAVENGITTERSQRIAADEGLDTRINELMGLAGAPRMAATAAAMTDSSKIYVYTGSETGYLTGHWYYYNGTEWADGGVYQATAVDTDKTLTVENMAADAAVTGERIDECMAAFVVNSASGDIASFADGADGVPLKDLVVNIQPKQAGTGDPSPSNVRAISGWDSATITKNGKNLFPKSIYGTTMAGITWTVYDDGSIHAQGTSTGRSYCFVTKYYVANFRLKPGTYTYNLAATGTGASSVRSLIGGYKGNTMGSAYAGNIALCANNRPVTFTVTEEKSQWYIDCSVEVGSSGITVDCMIYPQIEVGSTATDYEPYTANTYEVSFGTAGTVYGGTMDVTSGMLTVTNGMIDLGTLTWGFHDESRKLFRGGNISNLAKKTAAQMYAISSSYAYTTSGFSTMPDKTMRGNMDTPTSWYIRDTSYSTVADFQSAMSGVQLVYELQTPISVQLDPVTIASLIGNNNIWSDTGSVASCEYRADTKLYLEKLTNPDDDMVANANITSGQYFMVNNNLYLATSAIASGATIVPGTNCTATNLAAALNAINA